MLDGPVGSAFVPRALPKVSFSDFQKEAASKHDQHSVILEARGQHPDSREMGYSNVLELPPSCPRTGPNQAGWSMNFFLPKDWIF